MKRIIICSDGTWNKPNNIENGFLVRSNVQKIFEVIAKSDGDIKQIKHYDNGVASIGSAFTKAINGAIGIGLEENIINAYKFIIWNYEPGDELYLFGFSRGAYTVRSLAGLIRRCGILKNQDLCLIEEAYSIYRDRSQESNVGEPRSVNFIAQNSYPNPEIKFLGVWDTVGALGIPHTSFRMRNRKRYKFHDLTLSSTIKHAYQAMAIDERRGLFDVNLWKQSKRAIDENIHQHVEQRWFAGVHCEVGGGYHEEQLSDLPLLWMIHKAQHAGLFINMGLAVTNDDFPVFLAPDVSARPHDSLTFIFKLSPIITRKIGRENGFNEYIDASVLERIRQLNGYDPANVRRALDKGVKVVETVDLDQINNHSYAKPAVV